ncbi:hypothetical protein CBS101457_001789 [Exobasidium rhododendri]|nr:hypothetical protein CBS101457_001789 [Exobasidium rhododendri]
MVGTDIRSDEGAVDAQSQSTTHGDGLRMSGGDDIEENKRERSNIPVDDNEENEGIGAKGPTANSDFPEGGLSAWANVAGTFVVMAFSFGYLNAYGVFQEYYTQTFLQDYSQSDIAWIGAMQYFFIFGMGLFAGRAFDLGLFKPLMAFTIIFTTFCQMMLSLCTTYYQIFLAQGVGLGISFGLLFNLAVSIPTHWFLKKRATALGVQAAGSSIGGVIFPILIRKLLPEIGFGWTMRLIGFGCLIFLGGSYFLMRTRLPPLQDVRNGGWKKVKWVDVSAFRQWSYNFFIAGNVIIMLGLYTPFVYMDTFTAAYHIPADGYWLSIMNAASVFGRIVPGIIADRFGRINTVIPHTAIAAIFIFVFPLFTNLSMIAFTLVFGYCSGCFVSLIPSCAAQLGSTDTVGNRLGMMFFLMSFGGLLGTPISGYILGSTPPLKWWATAGFSAAYSVEVLPIYVITAAAVGGAGWYISRLARGPDVVWDHKGNPQPWQAVQPGTNTKLYTINQKYDKQYKRERL